MEGADDLPPDDEDDVAGPAALRSALPQSSSWTYVLFVRMMGWDCTV